MNIYNNRINLLKRCNKTQYIKIINIVRDIINNNDDINKMKDCQTRNIFTNKQFKLRYIKGDIEIDDDFEEECEKYNSENLKALNTNDTSLVAEMENFKNEFNREIPKVDLQSIKERNMTPQKKGSTPINAEEKRSVSRERDEIDLNPKAVILEKRQSVFSNKEMKISTDKDSLIRFENQNFMTKDPDLKLLVDLVNENVSAWKRVLSDEHVNIYKKSFNSNPTILLKTYATINGYDKDEILEAIINVNIRSKWDEIFEEFKELDDETIYCSIKVIFINLVT
jgi:hypothetical protein